MRPTGSDHLLASDILYALKLLHPGLIRNRELATLAVFWNTGVHFLVTKRTAT